MCETSIFRYTCLRQERALQDKILIKKYGHVIIQHTFLSIIKERLHE